MSPTIEKFSTADPKKMKELKKLLPFRKVSPNEKAKIKAAYDKTKLEDAKERIPNLKKPTKKPTIKKAKKPKTKSTKKK